MAETLEHDRNTSTGDLEDLIASFEQSHVIIGQRVEKSVNNPRGFKHVGIIIPDKPAILFMGGTGTELHKGADESANGYLSKMEAYIKNRGIEEVLEKQGKDPDIKKSVGFYSIIYDFGRRINGDDICDADTARGKLYIDHKQIWSKNEYKIVGDKVYYKGQIEKGISADTLKPHYIEELFNMAFRSRICGEDGKRLSFEDACKRVRNITVCAHCHGAYTFLKIEEKMQQMMKQLGYSNEERAQIQSQLLCIAFSPDTPLGISKSKMISFISSFDNKLNGGYYYNFNNFKEAVRILHASKEKIEPSYFPEKQGEFFLIDKIYNSCNSLIWDKEHNLLNNDREPMTNAGKVLFNFAANAIAGGIKSSLEETPLPSVEQLVCGENENNKVLFQKLKENGEILWRKIKNIIKIRIAGRFNQKTL